ncbi:hypothetical protein [Paenibacillus arenilitoris]|uniref:Uncharacterized protein n=1 Tax=Paenibacillus arenilitoris TaxID=2772299 RepID=A0A927CLZ6_9BACL|nr:hypothetical protein [Paenibacillus arenilitoris]MBD2870009.1 hypothetical protein [Paenibacillus arenilitoris]
MTDIVSYDKGFNANEWFVIASFVISTVFIWVFPRILSPLETSYALLAGMVFGLIADHTVAVPPLDLYDVGDDSNFTLFDLFSYVMYMPFGYWFIYWHERMRIGGIGTMSYILLWTIFGYGIEWLGTLAGVFHYKNGYRIEHSIPVYLFVQSLHLALYKLAFSRDRMEHSK